MASHPLVVTPQTRLSLEQWARLGEDDEGELVDGILEEEEVPTIIHEIVVAWLLEILIPWARRHGGFALGSEVKLAVGKRRGRKPDLSVFVPPRLPRGSESVSYVPPLIAVEVLTSRPRDQQRDRVEKIRDYAKFGVSYYWLVDPMLRTFEVFELQEHQTRYGLALSAIKGRLRKIPGCHRLLVDLDELWSLVGALERHH